MSDELIEMAELLSDCDLSDHAPIYAGSAVWNDWRNHVPLGVRAIWDSLSRRERAIAFLCCKAVTHYMHLEKPGDMK